MSAGSNYASGLATSLNVSDESGNLATLDGAAFSDYQRNGKMVWISMEIHLTSLSGMTTTDELRIIGLPYAHHSGSDEHDAGAITGTAFNGINYTDITVFGIPGTTTCHIRGTRFVNSANAPILVSDISTGSLRCLMGYFIETGA